MNAELKLRQSPALDGIRAGAVLIVMASHAGAPVPGGQIGVDVFFGLSGFLITYLLLQELMIQKNLNFGRFYAKRALRLYPALITVLVFVLLFAWLIPESPRSEASLQGLIPAAFYFANWVRAVGGLGELGLLEHTWSLSVEEQFYLLWPLVIWLVFRFSGRLLAVFWVSLAGATISLILRLTIASGESGYARIFNGSDTQADQLLFGCALAAAVMWAISEDKIQPLRRVFSIAAWPSVIFLMMAAFLWPPHGFSLFLRVTMTFVGMAAAVVIGHVYLSSRGRLARLLSIAPVVYVGKRSYALYLWHYPILVILFDSSIPNMVAALVGLALSFVAAELSYRLVESPFLRIKDRLSKQGQPTNSPASAV